MLFRWLAVYQFPKQAKSKHSAYCVEPVR